MHKENNRSGLKLSSWVETIGDHFRGCGLLASLLPAIPMSLLSLLCFHVHCVSREDSKEGQTIHGHYDENYFMPFAWEDLIILALLLIVWVLFFRAAEWVVSRKTELFIEITDGSSSNMLSAPIGVLISFVVIVICWSPYLLSWFPGGIFADTIGVIRWAETGVWNNQHTLLYIAIWKACIGIAGFFGRGIVVAASIMTILQFCAVALSVALSVRMLARWGVKKGICLVVMLAFALVPLFPLSAISLWKDVFFACFVFLLSMAFIDICLRETISWKNQLVFSILLTLVSFSRNNGIYVSVATVLCFLIVMRKQLRGKWKAFSLPLIATLLSLIVQGPIYGYLGLSSSLVENIGVPLQQIAAAVTYGGLEEEQTAYLDSIMPIGMWAEAYKPFIVDSIKWNASFDASVISADFGSFWRTYLLIGLENPSLYLEAFLMNNAGFWDPLVGTNEDVGHYQLAMWGTIGSWYPELASTQCDIIQNLTGFSLRGILRPTCYPSAAIFAWTMLVSMFLILNQAGKRRYALLVAPVLFVWLTLMIATPLAYSFRYFVSGALMAPIFILLPFIVRVRSMSE